jgi:hypothetical protein
MGTIILKGLLDLVVVEDLTMTFNEYTMTGISLILFFAHFYKNYSLIYNTNENLKALCHSCICYIYLLHIKI